MIENEDLSAKLKNFALKQGADLIGISSVERFENAPEEHKPTYFLPDAKSVVVFATAIPKGVCNVWGLWEEKGKTIGPYMWYGHIVQDYSLLRLSNIICIYLEKKGFKTVTFPHTFPPAEYRFLMGRDKYEGDYLFFSDFSLRHAAVAAGLGEFGLSGLLITPEFGPRQRIHAIITNAPFKPDPMYYGPKLCRPGKCLKEFNRPCINRCPTQALSAMELQFCKIGNKNFGYAKFNQGKCLWAVSGLHKGSGSKTHIELPDEITWDNYREALARQSSIDKDLKGDRHHIYGIFCGICLHQCPAPLTEYRGVRCQARIRQPSKQSF